MTACDCGSGLPRRREAGPAGAGCPRSLDPASLPLRTTGALALTLPIAGGVAAWSHAQAAQQAAASSRQTDLDCLLVGQKMVGQNFGFYQAFIMQ